MKKVLSPCCGKPLVFHRLETHYKEQNQFAITEKQVCCYKYICPFCGTILDFDKDWIREIWAKANPTKKFILKL